MNQSNVVQGTHYRFTVLTEKLLRLEYSESGVFEDAPSQTVINREFPKGEFKVVENEEKLEIITDYFHLHYKKGAFSSSTLFIDVKYNFSNYSNRWYYGSASDTLKGTARTLDKADGEIELEEGILSKNGFAILDDSHSFLLNEENEPVAREHVEEDLYFFGYGRSYLEALGDYYRLTGKTPLLPRYALGNWWSRYWRYDEEEYIDLMNRFESEGVPLSVSVIDMDWHLTDVPSRFGSGWTGYTWNPELFPNPKRFLQNLKARGLAVTLNVHPADGIRAFENAYDQVAKRLGLNKEQEEPATFNMLDKKFREAYFKDVHHPLEEEGVDFWWIDWQQGTESGEKGLDPLWQLNHYHYIDVERKGKHDVILSRYAGPGSHRYPIGFSGDTVISWESLDFQPYFTSTASNIGYTWWSHDIGGHMQGYRDDELSLRWVQYGVFSPINRLHSSSSAFTGKEPWRYNEIAYNSMKSYLRLRHRLLPYLYTMNVLTHEEGIPLVQPLYYRHPLEEEAYHEPNEYYFGSEFLVKPITTKSDDNLKLGSTTVWFPEGTWFDFFTGKRYKGGSKLRIFRSQTEMPVFVKAGSIIPLDANPLETKGDELPNELSWRVFPGASHEFELVEHLEGKEARTKLILDWENRRVTIEVEGDTSILPKSRQHQLKIVGVNRAKDLQKHMDYVEDTNVLTIRGLIHSEKIVVDLSSVEQVGKQDVRKEMFTILDRAEMAYSLKDQLLQTLQASDDDYKTVAVLHELEDKNLADALYEMIYIKNS